MVAWKDFLAGPLRAAGLLLAAGGPPAGRALSWGEINFMVLDEANGLPGRAREDGFAFGAFTFEF